MAKTTEKVAHPELVGGTQTSLHSHAGGGGGPATIKLTADQAAITATTATNITGMSFAVEAGKYYRFEFLVIFRTVITTTGIKLTVSYPATTRFAATARIPRAADGTAGQWLGWVTSSGDLVVGNGVQAANTDYLAVIHGIIVPSANGTLQLQAASEVSGSGVTVRQGTCGILYTL